MSGIKGKSGGPRKNAGGARSGAGRPKKEKKSANEISERDMLQLLQDVALGRVEATNIQVRAAIAAIQYTHVKMGDVGKKDAKNAAAKAAGKGRFMASAPPKLVYSK